MALPEDIQELQSRIGITDEFSRSLETHPVFRHVSRRSGGDGGRMCIAVSSQLYLLSEKSKFSDVYMIDLSQYYAHKKLSKADASHRFPGYHLVTRQPIPAGNHISTNRDCNMLLIWGPTTCDVVTLPVRNRRFIGEKSSRGSEETIGEIVCQTATVFRDPVNGVVQILRAAFHPMSSVHVLVLTNDGQLRMYKVGRKKAEAIYHDIPPKVTHFYFNKNSEGWGAFTAFLSATDGHIYRLCPIIPRGCLLPSPTLHSMFALARTKEVNEFLAPKASRQRYLRWISELEKVWVPVKSEGSGLGSRVSRGGGEEKTKDDEGKAESSQFVRAAIREPLALSSNTVPYGPIISVPDYREPQQPGTAPPEDQAPVVLALSVCPSRSSNREKKLKDDASAAEQVGELTVLVVAFGVVLGMYVGQKEMLPPPPQGKKGEPKGKFTEDFIVVERFQTGFGTISHLLPDRFPHMVIAASAFGALVIRMPWLLGLISPNLRESGEEGLGEGLEALGGDTGVEYVALMQGSGALSQEGLLGCGVISGQLIGRYVVMLAGEGGRDVCVRMPKQSGPDEYFGEDGEEGAEGEGKEALRGKGFRSFLDIYYQIDKKELEQIRHWCSSKDGEASLRDLALSDPKALKAFRPSWDKFMDGYLALHRLHKETCVRLEILPKIFGAQRDHVELLKRNLERLKNNKHQLRERVNLHIANAERLLKRAKFALNRQANSGSLSSAERKFVTEIREQHARVKEMQEINNQLKRGVQRLAAARQAKEVSDTGWRLNKRAYEPLKTKIVAQMHGHQTCHTIIKALENQMQDIEKKITGLSIQR